MDINLLDDKTNLAQIHPYIQAFTSQRLTRELRQANKELTQNSMTYLKQLCSNYSVGARDSAHLQLALSLIQPHPGLMLEQNDKELLKFVRQSLSQQSFSEDDITAVISYISAYLEDREPTNHLEEIFLDSLFVHFGQKKLRKRSKLYWEYRSVLTDESTGSRINIYKEVRQRLLKHCFYTAFARERFQKRKRKNLKSISKALTSEIEDNSLANNKMALTMVKTAMRNHIDLVNIADKKAGIMISINAILMTIMIPIMGSYIIDITSFLIPAVILITTCGLAVILAALATRPQLGSGKIKDQMKRNGDKSLFYFGNFYKMKKEDYTNSVKELIVREKSLENSAITDLFDLGVILGVKYKRLRLCYIVFSVGMALTMVAFMMSFFVSPQF